MTFKELKVGSRFIIIREHDKSLIYSKINERSHYNTSYRNQKISIHSNTQVEEIK